MAKTFLLYFDDAASAKTVRQRLESEIFVVAVKEYAADAPDPGLSVSALMVGSMPNLTQGIFGAGNAEEKGAYLLIVLDEDGHDEFIAGIAAEYNGTILRKES